MIESQNRFQEVFDKISKIDKTKKLNQYEKSKYGFSYADEVWEIETEIFFCNDIKIIVLHIVLTNHFPMSFPKVFLSPKTFDEIRYIPHLDSNRLICTYDSEIVSPNTKEPYGVIVESIAKAKRIIEDGISNQNVNAYDDEFIAYWECKYDGEFSPIEAISLIDSVLDSSEVKILIVNNKVLKHQLYLHQNDSTYERFKKYLDVNNIIYTDYEVFWLEEDYFNLLIPPFHIKYKDIISSFLLEDIDKKNFERFINRKGSSQIVVTRKKINNTEYLLGWKYDKLSTYVPGFRPGEFKHFNAIVRNQSNDYVRRFYTEKFTFNRLANRSKGNSVEMEEYSFCIAGIGSIGSNLAFYLNSMNVPEFKFIDKDFLNIENLGRHFLGLDSVCDYKTKGLMNYFNLKNPLQRISTKEQSIVDVVSNDLDFINNSSFLFVAIGKYNIEKWIADRISDGIIKIPVFFLWVEPFLSGGHCLFIHPNKSNYNDYYENDLFKYNVISNKEYSQGRQEFALKESGCQTTYIPYSSSNIISFLSAVYPFIIDIIEHKYSESKSITWIGNTEEIKNKGIELSDVGKKNIIGKIFETSI